MLRYFYRLLINPLLARGRDRLETGIHIELLPEYGIPLLARGRDRLETLREENQQEITDFPLLARGRDRLETADRLFPFASKSFSIPYSLGDAIDWKLLNPFLSSTDLIFPYSLGDAIDWKHVLGSKPNSSASYSPTR